MSGLVHSAETHPQDAFSIAEHNRSVLTGILDAEASFGTPSEIVQLYADETPIHPDAPVIINGQSRFLLGLGRLDVVYFEPLDDIAREYGVYTADRISDKEMRVCGSLGRITLNNNEVFTIGRASDKTSDWPLSLGVSRLHAGLERTPRGVTVRNFKAKNGTSLFLPQ